jgi:hypothetical protein
VASRPAKRVLHRAGGVGVDVALDGGQVDDILAEEVVGNVDALGEDLVEHEHLRLGLVGNPLHVLVAEVVEDGDVVLLKKGDVVVQVFALECVGDDGLVLHADQVLVAVGAESLDRAFKLPWRGVGAGERVVPGDVVLEYCGRAFVEGAGHAGQFSQAGNVFEDSFRPCAGRRQLWHDSPCGGKLL